MIQWPGMIRLPRMKRLICECLIIREWIENGEFMHIDQVIVVGTRIEAVMVNILFAKEKIGVFYTTEMNRKHKYKKQTKWIVFDEKIKKTLQQNEYDILFVPQI